MKTAVEWLIEEYFGSIENCTPRFRNHIKQALAMEKEQMMNFCSIYANLISQGHPITPSEFYNETFKSEEL